MKMKEIGPGHVSLVPAWIRQWEECSNAGHTSIADPVRTFLLCSVAEHVHDRVFHGWTDFALMHILAKIVPNRK